MYVTCYISDHAEWQLTGVVNFTAYWLFMIYSADKLALYPYLVFWRAAMWME